MCATGVHCYYSLIKGSEIMKKQLRKLSFKNTKRMIAVVLLTVILTGLLSVNVFADYKNITNEYLPEYLKNIK